MILRALSFLLLATTSLHAGLHDYQAFIVADAGGKTPTRGVRITYLGTNGYQFETAGRTLLIDPYFSRISMWQMLFSNSVQPNQSRVENAMAHLSPRADAILITHAHIDHLFDAPVVMQKTGARLIGSRSAVELAVAAGSPAARLDAVRVGDVRRIGPWKIRALPAMHDRVFLIGVPFPGKPKNAGPPRRASDWVCGEPLAFLIEADGKRIYIDSGGRPELPPPANLGPIDLAIIGVALPDARARFVEAIRRLRPRYILPSHQDNFFEPLGRGFIFGPFTDFPQVLRDDERAHLPGRLILLDYFRRWTLQ